MEAVDYLNPTDSLRTRVISDLDQPHHSPPWSCMKLIF
jgi:hypothetical protein